MLFRRFLLWYLGAWAGPVLAVAISSVLFGFAHLYLGVPHVIRTAIVGVIFALVVLAAGSLWPVIIIHVARDLVAGDLAYRGAGRGPRGRLGAGSPGGGSMRRLAWGRNRLGD